MATRSWSIYLTRSVLQLLIVCSIFTFVITAFNSGASWFLNSSPWSKRLPDGLLKIPYSALTHRRGRSGHSEFILMTSDKAFKLCVLLVSSAVAAVATLALRALPEGDHSLDFDESRPASKAKWLLNAQLPPHQFLLWWCGGVSVMDAVILLGVLSMAFFWIQQLTSARWRLIDEMVADGRFSQKYAGLTVSQAKLEALATRIGFGILACAMALFYPVPRSSFLQALFKTDFSFLIRYHRWLGHCTLLLTSCHGLVWYFTWALEHRWWQQATAWQSNKIPFLAGSCAWASGLLLWVTSFEFIRRQYFEVFYRCHMLGFIGFYVFGSLHYSGLFYYAIPGFLLYMLDLTFRLAQWMNTSTVHGTMLPDNTLSLSLHFTPDTKLLPNSFLFISVPTASRAQWHPFTLAYVRNSLHVGQPAVASLHIKPYGRWSQAVAQEIWTRGHVLAKVDGPYGGSSPLLDSTCQVAVIFAGGIGVTPMLGLLDDLCRRHAPGDPARAREGGRAPPKVLFVWACRSPETFQLLSPRLLAESRCPGSWLQVQLFCTAAGRELSSSEQEEVPLMSRPPKLSHGQAATTVIRGSSAGLGSPDVRAQYSLASPFFLQPSLLQGYGIGYFWWAVCHILCFAGAFFTILAAEAWGQVGQFLYDDGFVYWGVNALRLLALFVGGMGFPALLIFPLVAYKRHKALRAADGEQASDTEALCQEVQPEAGVRPDYATGRPRIHNILLEALHTHRHVPEIHVHVAGPPAMVHDVKSHAVHLNLKPAADGRPHLTCAVDSFAL